MDLFSTPFQAVHTRTFTQPRWGARVTGESGLGTYTLLVGEDEGGGSVVIPGTLGSGLARQDFSSTVTIGRLRHDFGTSFASFLYSGREIDGGGSNRVFGPDFQWRPRGGDSVTGQFLLSQSSTPRRPDLAGEWDGRDLSGHAARLSWSHRQGDWDTFVRVDEIDEDFRADNGFVPQVGWRGAFVEGGHTWFPEDRPVSRLRLFTYGYYDEDSAGRFLEQGIVPGVGLDARWNSFVRLEVALQKLRAGEQVFERVQLRPTIEVRPGGILSAFGVYGSFGDQIDFAHERLGDGASVELWTDVRPTDHLLIFLTASRRWLDVETDDGPGGRLFTADVARLRTTYTFTARSWLRLIGQWVETEREPALWASPVDDHSAAFAGSAVLAYKLSWQTVVFLGYADDRAWDATDRLQPAGRQLFLKLSYAFQG